jgi:hypothetical protein
MKFIDLRRPYIGVTCVAVAFVFSANCYVNRVPDLSPSDAVSLISRAPEFNRYARLVKVESIHHQKDSMEGVSFGTFAFLYLNSPADAPLIEATVDFRYHEGKWYLNQFDYGCPHDCHFVYVYDGPEKHHLP